MLAARHRLIDEGLWAALPVAHDVAALEAVVEAIDVANFVSNGLAVVLRATLPALIERKDHAVGHRVAVEGRDAAKPLTTQTDVGGTATNLDQDVVAAGGALVGDAHVVGGELVFHAGHETIPGRVVGPISRDDEGAWLADQAGGIGLGVIGAAANLERAAV